MKLPRRPIRVSILLMAILASTSACTPFPTANPQSADFAAQWRLTPEQRRDFIQRQAALEVKQWRELLALDDAMEASIKQELKRIAKRMESGIARRGDYFSAQSALSKATIQRLQSSESLATAERDFHAVSGSNASVDQPLSVLEEADSLEEYGDAARADEALWTRHETRRAIVRQCTTLDALADSMNESNLKAMQIGRLSFASYRHQSRELYMQRRACIGHRYQFDRTRLELITLLLARQG